MRPLYRENWWSKDNTHPPEAKRYYYFRAYIKAGSREKQLDYVWCVNDEVFLRLLNMWNGDSRWKYWAEL